MLSALKMEHVIAAPATGTVESIEVAATDTVQRGDLLMVIAKNTEDDAGDGALGEGGGADKLEMIRPNLEEVIKRQSYKLDENRPEAVRALRIH